MQRVPVSMVEPRRVPSPTKIYVHNYKRVTDSFISKITAWNIQLRDADTAHRLVSRDQFVEKISEAVERLKEAVPEKQLGSVFIKLSGERSLLSWFGNDPTLIELASDRFKQDPRKSAAYARFEAGLGIAGKTALHIAADKAGRTPLFNDSTFNGGQPIDLGRAVDEKFSPSAPPYARPMIDPYVDAKEIDYNTEAPLSAPQFQLRTSAGLSAKDEIDRATNQSKVDTDHNVAVMERDISESIGIYDAKYRQLNQQQANDYRLGLVAARGSEIIGLGARQIAVAEKGAIAAAEAKNRGLLGLTQSHKISVPEQAADSKDER